VTIGSQPEDGKGQTHPTSNYYGRLGTVNQLSYQICVLVERGNFGLKQLAANSGDAVACFAKIDVGSKHQLSFAQQIS